MEAQPTPGDATETCDQRGDNPNPNNPNNPNNFSYEKVSVSYDVVRAVFVHRNFLITGNWQTHFRSWSSYGTGRTGRHFSYKTHLSSYKESATGPHPRSVFAMKTTRHGLPQFVLSEGGELYIQPTKVGCATCSRSRRTSPTAAT